MKKTTLILAGLLIASTASLNAGFFGSSSKVNANNNKVDATVDKSTVRNSVVGMKIKAKGSKVNASNNKVTAKVTGHSKVTNSTVGLNIVAEK